MTTKIVLCPTLRRAFYEWHRLADTYPDYWVNVCEKPMSLTSVLGTKYIFCSVNEVDKLAGHKSDDFVAIDEISPRPESEET